MSRCCEGKGQPQLGCYHDHCTGPINDRAVDVIKAEALEELLSWASTKMDLDLPSFKVFVRCRIERLKQNQ